MICEEKAPCLIATASLFFAFASVDNVNCGGYYPSDLWPEMPNLLEKVHAMKMNRAQASKSARPRRAGGLAPRRMAPKMD